MGSKIQTEHGKGVVTGIPAPGMVAIAYDDTGEHAVVPAADVSRQHPHQPGAMATSAMSPLRPYLAEDPEPSSSPGAASSSSSSRVDPSNRPDGPPPIVIAVANGHARIGTAVQTVEGGKVSFPRVLVLLTACIDEREKDGRRGHHAGGVQGRWCPSHGLFDLS